MMSFEFEATAIVVFIYTVHRCCVDDVSSFKSSFKTVSVVHSCLQLVESQQTVHDLRLQLGTLQGSHKETVDQLNERSKQAVMLKTEVDRLTHQNASMAEEVSIVVVTRLYRLHCVFVCERLVGAAVGV
jgi:hypothetical protein